MPQTFFVYFFKAKLYDFANNSKVDKVKKKNRNSSVPKGMMPLPLELTL